MFILFVGFKHLVFHLDLSISQFFQYLDVFVRVLLQRNSLIIILVKIVHNLLSELSRLIWSHAIPLPQMILDLLEVYDAIALALTVVALVDLVELDTQLHLLPFVELLLAIELVL